MGRKRILDITSVKKKDHMRVVGVSERPGAVEPFAVFANTYNACLYAPTVRARNDRASPDMPARTSKEVYWKGYKDELVIQSATSDPWEWRRIVFSVKGGPDATGVEVGAFSPLEFNDIGGVPSLEPASTTGTIQNPAGLIGITRAARKMLALTPAAIQGFTGGLFKGINQIDFNTGYGQMLTSAVDKENIHIHSDVTRSIRSGNDSGVLKKFKIYHPLEKKMVYADQESGSLLTQTSFAASNSPLGDVYIFDLFVQLQGAPGSLTVSGQGTAYWHER